MTGPLLQDYLAKISKSLAATKRKSSKDASMAKCTADYLMSPLRQRLKLVAASKEMASNRDGSANTVVCSGYYDEEGGFRVSCTFTASATSTDIIRKTWREPNDPETDDEDDEDGDGGANDAKDRTSLPRTRIYPRTGRGRKKAVMVLLESARKHRLRMPADEMSARVAVGTILMNHVDEANGTYDLPKAWKALRKEFPSAAAEAEKRAEGPRCAVDANSDIADMFALVAELAKKAGSNPFKVRANAKVAVLIRSVPYEIKLEHLKGKHAIQKKGPNKIEGFGKSSADAVTELLTLRNAGEFTSLDQISSIAKLREKLGQETEDGFAGMY